MDDTFWLSHIFGRSLEDKTNPEGASIAADVAPADALRLVTRIFRDCGDWLTPFTDNQVAEGLVFIGSAGESNWMDYLYDPAVERPVRYDCIRSIETLYCDCFAR